MYVRGNVNVRFFHVEDNSTKILHLQSHSIYPARDMDRLSARRTRAESRDISQTNALNSVTFAIEIRTGNSSCRPEMAIYESINLKFTGYLITLIALKHTKCMEIDLYVSE